MIDMDGAELLTSLHKRYMTNLGTTETQYSAQSLVHKITKTFPGLMQTKVSNKTGIVLYSPHLSPETAIRMACYDEHSLKEAALYLRTLVLNVLATQKSLPDPLTAEALAEGQGYTPEPLLVFFRTLFSGTDAPTEHIIRQAESVCNDIVFIATRSRTKPSKHLCLGLGLKSLTGSRQVIDILNRFGHSIGYHTVESIETELATVIKEQNHATPDGIKQEPGLFTGLAWDNYDENSETLSGSGTLHDTVGICYQNRVTDQVDDGSEKVDTMCKTLDIPVKPRSKAMKRSFHMQTSNLEPYRKKPKVSKFEYEIKEVPRPLIMTLLEYRDMLWMVHLNLGKTPMWTGWNSLVTDDPLPRQKVLYMENLTLPPTRLDVIVETLKISQKVASECDEKYIVVHYDLAIAKPALQIQAAESPRFDNVFIAFGPSHICLAYFGALGHFIDSSGGPEILIESDVLASGSLNGFLSGKHYNRCKRLHPMLATAFQSLHFQQFLKEHGPLTEEVKRELTLVHDSPSPQAMDELESSQTYLQFMRRYTEYTDVTLSGGHGSTARYWMLYVKLVHLYLILMRACKTAGLELFTYVLGEMRHVFFACNRPNYARWMVRYYLNLANIDKTHPGLRAVLENGALSIRRTNKSFSRTPVDMTLEQTVNADAASRRTGIAAFGTMDSAKRRWMVTRAARSTIVGALLTKAGLKSVDDTTKELKPYRVQKDNDDLTRLQESIKSRMNPFVLENRDENLYCLTTGRNVPDDIKLDLLHCSERGKQWCEKFLDGCFADATRLEKPIPRNKIKNFASAAAKSTLRKDTKLIELQGTRDLFGRLLCLSTEHQIDLEKVFTYPLTPVPLSLAHLDGSMNKTDKAKLLHKIENMVENENPPAALDVTIVDAMFMLHTLQNLPNTYGEIAEMILAKLCRMSPRVDLVFDTYFIPSIKDIEHDRRSADDSTYTITGSQQKRPKDWQKALRSSSFKTAFFHFLLDEWSEHANTEVLKGHQLHLGIGEKCYCITVKDGTVHRGEIPALACCHEEADTRIIYHMQSILGTEKNIAVRSSDTDVFILLLHHVSQFDNPTSSVWMDVGLSSNNTLRYINISQLVENLDDAVIFALPALHAFTGSDFTASFMNKGKVKALDLMMKNQEFVDAFGKLGESATVPAAVHSTIEKFTCALYGMPKLSSINDVRYALFQRKYAGKKHKGPLEQIQGVNPSGLPPCQSVLQKKVLRTNYVASVWKRAGQSKSCQFKAENHGWLLTSKGYVIHWFDCAQLPQRIVSILDDNLQESNEEKDISSEEAASYSSDESEFEEDCFD